MEEYRLSSEDEERILQRAIRDYPLGTAYQPIYGDLSVIPGDVSVISRKLTAGRRGAPFFYVEGGQGFIYIRGKWAMIISTGVTKDNYLIFN